MTRATRQNHHAHTMNPPSCPTSRLDRALTLDRNFALQGKVYAMTKKLFFMLSPTILLVCCLVLPFTPLLAVVFYFSAPNPPIERARLCNPEHPLEAVFAEIPTGATDPTLYSVHLVLKGAPIGEDPVFRAADISSNDMSWQDQGTLVIQHSTERVYFHEEDTLLETSEGPVRIRVKEKPRDLLETHNLSP